MNNKMENEKMEHPQKYYQTKDLFLACYLMCQGVIFEGLGQTGNNSHYLFIFSDPVDCENLERSFWQGGHVNVQSFIAAYKMLKSKLFKEKGW